MTKELNLPTISVGSRAIVFAAYSLMAIAVFGITIWKLFVPALATGNPPPTWSWSSLSIMELANLFVFAWVGSIIYKRFGTHLSEIGVSVPTLQGRILLAWPQVRQLKANGQEIILSSDKLSVAVNILCFSEPQQVIDFIYRHIPTNVLGKKTAY